MAIQSSAVWEFRATGSNNNGGGFDAALANAGTDYSQQDAAQLSLTDCACAQNATTVTSATGGFTAAMIGNAIYFVSGTNFLVQPFFILTVPDGNTITVDRTPCTAGIGSGGNGKVGGARSAPTDAFLETWKPGNIAWYKAGSYTLVGSIATTTGIGTSSLLIEHIGYDATRGDEPAGDSRPLINDAGSYTMTFGAYTAIRNFRLECSATGNKLTMTTGCSASNVKITATEGTCAVANSGAVFTSCEFTTESTTSVCVALAANGKIYGSLVSGGLRGVYCNSSTSHTVGNLIYGCAESSFGVGGTGALIVGNTLYGSPTGILADAGLSATSTAIIINNIISGHTTGAAFNVIDRSIQVFNNVWNNTTDASNFTKGPTDITADPLFVNAAAGDFTLQATSPAIAAGAGVSGYKWNIGADQGDHVTGGAGETSHTWVG